jgi:hypothetical protein
MLLKQQHFSVSGQAANPARQHPPLEYVYRHSHPLLQFLPQKLAVWIANYYAVVTMLGSWMCLQDLTSQDTGVQPHSMEFCRPASCLTCTKSTFAPSSQYSLSQICITGLCAPGVTHSTWNSIDFGEEKSRWVHIHGICIVPSCICWSYSWYIHVLSWLCSLQDVWQLSLLIHSTLGYVTTIMTLQNCYLIRIVCGLWNFVRLSAAVPMVLALPSGGAAMFTRSTPGCGTLDCPSFAWAASLWPKQRRSKGSLGPKLPSADGQLMVYTWYIHGIYYLVYPVLQ